MTSVCFYFEVHQPTRLRPYAGVSGLRLPDAFDTELDAEIMRRVAAKCYVPTNKLMLDLVRRHRGRFRIAYSITGTAIEQMRAYAPAALDSFKRLVDTGCVELVSETYYHSLSALYDTRELEAQVEQHRALMLSEFGVRPTVFRNTELIYSDDIGAKIARMGFRAVLAEGADDILGWRSPNYVYRHPTRPLAILPKNYRLSDDIAFRFSNRAWPSWPLTAETYADWLAETGGGGESINLFMDYETFGEHQWADTGIFDFLAALPGEILARGGLDFATPSEVVARYAPVAELSYPRVVSWADEARDLSAWLGNDMQRASIERCYALGDAIRRRNNPALTDLWRKLQTSDHFYYMCTKWFADGDVHAYFSPYESPYEAFIPYAHVLDELQARFGRARAGHAALEART